jgi:electron transfer flavoprotein alpha subunit
VQRLAQEIAQGSGLDVIGINVSGLVSYNGEVYNAVLGELLLDLSASYICIAHTTQGWDLAPSLAVRLNMACVTGVERVFQEDGGICFTRSICGGKILAHITPTTAPMILTVQPGVFKPTAFDNVGPGSVHMRAMGYVPQKLRPVGVKRAKEEGTALAEAEVIVSAGRGINKEENLGLIYQLAELFPKSAVAGSRPVCDMGWLEYKHQVGLTGATVTPRLYVACGISGTSQHVAGMRGAGFIVAINTDPDAAILNVADVCVVEDLRTFIPAFIAEYKKRKGHSERKINT